MATVTTTITPELARFPYTTPPSAERDLTAMPSAEIRFSTKGTSVAAAGVGDNQDIYWYISLPVGYAYVMLDAAWRIYPQVAGGTLNWGQSALMQISDAVVGADRDFVIPIEMRADGKIVGGNFESLIYRPMNLPNAILRPGAEVSGGPKAVLCEIDIYNETANDIAVTVSGFFRFLQFDLQQAHNVMANYPIPVRC